MKKAHILNFFIVVSLSVISIYGQLSTPAKFEPEKSAASAVELFPLSELKEGMRGVARTVFRGSEPEEFSVEILGVLPGGIGPKQDLIVGKISGGGADRTSVFAGMSGSPVYIDGKLVGAISYSFPFSKESICGITPIQQMIAIFEQKPASVAKPSEPKALSFAELASTTLELPGEIGTGIAAFSGGIADSKLAAVSGQSFQPIATPVTFSGFSQRTLDVFAPQLMRVGLMPVSAAGGTSTIRPMKPADATTLVGGDSVSMQLTRGDYSLAASGTVTFRDGEKIYAFGHPFLSLGTSDLPMSESHVVTVIPNLNNSFKLAVPDAMVGSMTQDRATGVFGKLGQAPKMIPVTINLQTSRGRSETLKFEVVKDDFLTPLLLNLTTYNALVANERGLGDSTVQLDGEIITKGHEPIRLVKRFAGAQAAQMTAGAVAVPTSTLFRSRFDDLDIEGVVLNITSTDGSRTATLDRLAVDKQQVKAGETIEVQAFVRTDSGKFLVQRIPVTIPAGTPSGSLNITVGDGSTAQKNTAIQQFVPKNADELIQTINRMKIADRLYLQTFRTSNGAVVGVNEMPNLPPSVLATLNNDRTVGGFRPVVRSIVTEQEIAPSEYIISGQQSIAVEVVK
jgi:hypothetical protein